MTQKTNIESKIISLNYYINQLEHANIDDNTRTLYENAVTKTLSNDIPELNALKKRFRKYKKSRDE